MKYPGGYQIIDLKGVDISPTVATIEDPEILSVFTKIINGRLSKPVYITNFSADGDEVLTPLLLTDSYAIDQKFYASWGGDSNNIEITLSGLPTYITVQMV